MDNFASSISDADRLPGQQYPSYLEYVMRNDRARENLFRARNELNGPDRRDPMPQFPRTLVPGHVRGDGDIIRTSVTNVPIPYNVMVYYAEFELRATDDLDVMFGVTAIRRSEREKWNLPLRPAGPPEDIIEKFYNNFVRVIAAQAALDHPEEEFESEHPAYAEALDANNEVEMRNLDRSPNAGVSRSATSGSNGATRITFYTPLTEQERELRAYCARSNFERLQSYDRGMLLRQIARYYAHPFDHFGYTNHTSLRLEHDDVQEPDMDEDEAFYRKLRSGNNLQVARSKGFSTDPPSVRRHVIRRALDYWTQLERERGIVQDDDLEDLEDLHGVGDTESNTNENEFTHATNGLELLTVCERRYAAEAVSRVHMAHDIASQEPFEVPSGEVFMPRSSYLPRINYYWNGYMDKTTQFTVFDTNVNAQNPSFYFCLKDGTCGTNRGHSSTKQPVRERPLRFGVLLDRYEGTVKFTVNGSLMEVQRPLREYNERGMDLFPFITSRHGEDDIKAHFGDGRYPADGLLFDITTYARIAGRRDSSRNERNNTSNQNSWNEDMSDPRSEAVENAVSAYRVLSQPLNGDELNHRKHIDKFVNEFMQFRFDKPPHKFTSHPDNVLNSVRREYHASKNLCRIIDMVDGIELGNDRLLRAALAMAQMFHSVLNKTQNAYERSHILGKVQQFSDQLPVRIARVAASVLLLGHDLPSDLVDIYDPRFHRYMFDILEERLARALGISLMDDLYTYASQQPHETPLFGFGVPEKSNMDLRMLDELLAFHLS